MWLLSSLLSSYAIETEFKRYSKTVNKNLQAGNIKYMKCSALYFLKALHLCIFLFATACPLIVLNEVFWTKSPSSAVWFISSLRKAKEVDESSDFARIFLEKVQVEIWAICDFYKI